MPRGKPRGRAPYWPIRARADPRNHPVAPRPHEQVAWPRTQPRLISSQARRTLRLSHNKKLGYTYARAPSRHGPHAHCCWCITGFVPRHDSRGYQRRGNLLRLRARDPQGIAGNRGGPIRLGRRRKALRDAPGMLRGMVDSRWGTSRLDMSGRRRCDPATGYVRASVAAQRQQNACNS